MADAAAPAASSSVKRPAKQPLPHAPSASIEEWWAALSPALPPALASLVLQYMWQPAEALRALSASIAASTLAPLPLRFKPDCVVAPMVGQCDLPFRTLTRRYGATLVYSQMFEAHKFASSAQYRRLHLQTLRAPALPAKADPLVPSDEPLIVQFCGNEPHTLLAAAKLVSNLHLMSSSTFSSLLLVGLG
jgi:hypothetical protein